MLAGELYRPDAELAAEQAATKTWLVRYNAALALPVSQRHAILSERLGHVGTDAVIRPPFFCDYGYNIRLGDGVFLNFNCVILECRRSSARCRNKARGPRIRAPGPHRPRCLDRRRRHHPARRDHRRWCGDRCRQRGDTRRRRGHDGYRKPGPAAVTPILMWEPGALCDFAVRLLWKAPCLRGAPSALAARLPPELRLGARPGFPRFTRK